MSLYDSLTGLAGRHLKREQFEKLRAAYMQVRRRMQPVLRLVHGSFTAAQLREHLEGRFGRDFEVLMVHSSVNAMAPMYTGTALELVQMLIGWCGPDRTLAMPAFYFGEGGLGAAAALAANPRFDLRRTPSQMGIATELFRRSKGVIQSRHPVYRVAARGPLATELTAGHELARSGCGPGSPFDFMAKHNTLIIGIGKPFEVLTHVHHAEGVMGTDFPVPRTRGEPLDMTLVEGKIEIPFRLNRGGFAWKRNMWKLRQLMTPATLQEWKFHDVSMFAARAADVTEALVTAARRGETIYERP